MRRGTSPAAERSSGQIADPPQRVLAVISVMAWTKRGSIMIVTARREMPKFQSTLRQSMKK